MSNKKTFDAAEHFRLWSERKQKIQQRMREVADVHRKHKGSFADINENFRYIVQEWHRSFESMLDLCILNRYIAPTHKREFVTEDILSKIDFSKKIEILEYINSECKTKFNTKLMRYLNYLRNAVVHNFHNNHYVFTYDRGHLINDEKFDVLLKDLSTMFDDMNKGLDKITLVENTDRHIPF